VCSSDLYSSKYNGLVRLVDEKAAPEVAKASAEYLNADNGLGRVDSAMRKVQDVQKKYNVNEVGLKEATWNRLDPAARKELNEAYGDAALAVTAMGTEWWRTHADPGVIRESEVKRLDGLVPRLSKANLLYGGYEQANDIHFLHSLAGKLRTENSQRLDNIMRANQALPARISRIGAVSPEVNKGTGKPTGYWNIQTARPGDRGAHELYMPGDWLHGPGVDSRGTPR